MTNLTNPRGPWTSADLDLMPQNGMRHEIVDGELFMSKSPHWHHQTTCSNITTELDIWLRMTSAL